MSGRILFTGSRYLNDPKPILRALEELMGPGTSSSGWTFIHGAAAGADALVDRIAKTDWAGVAVERWPANWAEYGRGAGPIRNQQMVDMGAECCLAFPDPMSVGTWDCIRRAAAAGIKTRIYPVKP